MRTHTSTKSGGSSAIAASGFTRASDLMARSTFSSSNCAEGARGGGGVSAGGGGGLSSRALAEIQRRSVTGGLPGVGRQGLQKSSTLGRSSIVPPSILAVTISSSMQLPVTMLSRLPESAPVPSLEVRAPLFQSIILVFGVHIAVKCFRETDHRHSGQASRVQGAAQAIAGRAQQLSLKARYQSKPP